MGHVPKSITTCVLVIIFHFSQFIFLGSVTQWSKITYGEYVYPDWAQAVAWLLPLLSFLAMPIRAIYEIFHPKGSFREVQQPRNSEIWAAKMVLEVFLHEIQ